MRGTFVLFRTVSIMALMLFCLLVVSPMDCPGQDFTRIKVNTTIPQRLNLTVGKSLIIENPPPGEISLTSAAPNIVEVVFLKTGQIYLRGKSPGITSFNITEKDKVTAIFDVVVTPDVTLLKEKLQEILPDEKDLRVSASNDFITLAGSLSDTKNLATVVALAKAFAFTPEKVINLLAPPEEDPEDILEEQKEELRIFRLKEKIHEILPEEKALQITKAGRKVVFSGKVSNSAELSQVMSLASTYYPQENIVNLVEVGGVQQVMIEVRVAEMSRSLMRRLGFNFAYISSSGRNIGVSTLNDLTQLPGGEGFPSDPLQISDAVNFAFSWFGFDTSWAMFIDALKEEGLVHILAEPTLITLSGQNANFLAGGEFPIPVPQGDGDITIEFKEFGVGLSFTPTVLSEDKISMKVNPEVSELDYSTAVAFGGFVVPGVTTRRVSTVIELADGQSFAIAGLLQENVREIVSKFPILGDIPILGALFRSSNFQKNESELVIIATPHLVKPLDASRQPLPTDSFVEPTAAEQYLLGVLEGQGSGAAQGESPPASATTGGLEGDFGHVVPQ